MEFEKVSPDWDLAQYRLFAEERAQPFRDLLALLKPASFARAVDLGCGSGELTAIVAQQLGVMQLTGIDNSGAMLASTASYTSDSVRFAYGDIASWTSSGDHDLVVANASLQWIPDHADVLRCWTAALAPGGQIAVQVPANGHAPSHTVAIALADNEPYLSAFGSSGPPIDPVIEYVLEPKQYAKLLYDLGYEYQNVSLRIYPHVLPSTHHVVEWVKGTTLTRYKKVLSADLYEQFLTDYERELLSVVGEHKPFFFPFPRILLWGRLPL